MLGLVTLIVAVVAVVLLSPYIIPFFGAALPFLIGTALVVFAVIVIWAVLFVAAMIGVAIYYAVMHPMKVSKEHGDYGLKKVSESGRRQKGESQVEKSEEKSKKK